MKRKFKLITSIASLTAAVALLAVGAFAAGSRNIDVIGTVRFTAENVDATIEVFEGYAAKAGDTVDYGEGPNGEGPIGEVVFRANSGGNQAWEEVKLGEYGEITLNDSRHVYSYKITVTNTFGEGGYPILAEFSGFEAVGTIGVTIDAPKTQQQTSVVIPAQGHHDFIVKVTVDPTIVAPNWEAVLNANVALSIFNPPPQGE